VPILIFACEVPIMHLRLMKTILFPPENIWNGCANWWDSLRWYVAHVSFSWGAKNDKYIVL
jgi:hypothetical protein